MIKISSNLPFCEKYRVLLAQNFQFYSPVKRASLKNRPILLHTIVHF